MDYILLFDNVTFFMLTTAFAFDRFYESKVRNAIKSGYFKSWINKVSLETYLSIQMILFSMLMLDTLFIKDLIYEITSPALFENGMFAIMISFVIGNCMAIKSIIKYQKYSILV